MERGRNIELPKISVVTPSFDQGRFIDDCIQSVLNQDYPNFEHIIVDNCSIDETADVLAKYPHLKCIVEPDKGQCDAINKGIAAATGDWILWLNADDFMLEGAFEAFVRVRESKPNVNLIYGHMDFVDEAGLFVRRIYQLAYHYFMTFFGVYIPPSTGTFFRADFLKENPLDVDFHYVMDTEWTLRCGRRVKAAVINKPCSAFRVSEDNKTAQHITHNVVKPRHAEERKMNYERYIRPVLQRFGRLQPMVYRIGHWMALGWYKAAKVLACLTYLLFGKRG